MSTRTSPVFRVYQVNGAGEIPPLRNGRGLAESQEAGSIWPFYRGEPGIDGTKR